MLRDIREFADDPAAYTGGLNRRWGGLLSYRTWALPELSVELACPDAALHVGPQFVVLETAALDTAVAGTDQLQAVSSHVMFLARGKIGPFRVDAEPIRGVDGAIAVRTTLHDEGAGGKPITTGSYLFAVGR